MSDRAGEKSEQASQKRLDEAIKRGQFARSAEVQTIFVLMAALLAFKVSGNDILNRMMLAQTAILGHLGDIPLSVNVLQEYAVTAAVAVAACAGPIVIATMVGGLMAGFLQNRFQMSPDVLELNWDRLNPAEGFQRLFSARSFFPTVVAALKLVIVAGLSYSEIKKILADPIFYTAIDLAKIAQFLAEAAFKMTMRVGLALAVIAGADYAYQIWRTSQDLMMTKEEVKEEMKNTEGDPMVKEGSLCNKCLMCQKACLTQAFSGDRRRDRRSNMNKFACFDRRARFRTAQHCGFCLKVCPTGEDRQLHGTPKVGHYLEERRRIFAENGVPLDPVAPPEP